MQIPKFARVESRFSGSGSCICAITNKRAIVTSKSILKFASIYYLLSHEQIADITAVPMGAGFTHIIFHTLARGHDIERSTNEGLGIITDILNILQPLDMLPQDATGYIPSEPVVASPLESARNPLDDIQQLKELLDMGR